MKESYTATPTALIVRLEGELDQHSAVSLRAALDRKICEGCNYLIFDLSLLDFMDSSGIGVLLGRYRNLTALGGKTAIAAPKPLVLRILRLSAIDRIIPVYPTLAEALSA